MTEKRTRLWNDDWECVWDSARSGLTIDEALQSHLGARNATVDTGSFVWSGRTEVLRARFESFDEVCKYLTPVDFGRKS